LGDSTENLRDGGPPKSFVNSFGPDGQDLQKWPDIARDLSPLHFVSQSLPPTLIYHGDADTLVPLDQSIRFRDRAQQLQRPVQVVVHSGGGHGWLTMPWDIRAFANWFDQHLQD
jgi:dipeptidyl aminopeptidase/acylaminoacyl peptidase